MNEIEAIIFVHRRPARYLPYSLECAVRSNPGKRVILLGDASNRQVPAGVEHFLVDDFSSSAKALEADYIHMSTNSYFSEYVCIERWFVIDEFCKKQNIETFFYADSDVMLFRDLDEYLGNIGQDFDFSLSMGSSGHSSFWTHAALSQFCADVGAVYGLEDIPAIKELLKFYREFPKNKRDGGICDMTLLELFAKKKTVIDTARIVQGTTFDHNVNMVNNGPIGFEMHHGAKYIAWIDNIPHGIRADTKEKVAFNSLHFQGSGTKRWVPDVLTKKKQIFYRNRLSRLLSKLRR